MKKWATLVGITALVGKAGPKFVSVLAKLIKGAKTVKVGLAGASMASYAYIFSWEFAAIIMLMLFVHESGHIWAMKRCGVRTKGIYFLPFVGGVAVAEEEFPSRGAEAFIAIMGPIWGLALTLLAGLVYFVTKNPFFAGVSSWMVMINLFNLLPINPLDGGRILKSVAYSVHSRVGFVFLIFGFIASAFLAFKVGFGLFFFLLAIGGAELVYEYRRRTKHPAMNRRGIAGSVLGFIAVAGVLWSVMSYMKHIPGAAIAMELLKYELYWIKSSTSTFRDAEMRPFSFPKND